MIYPRLERMPDGSVAFEDLAPAFVLMMYEVPELLGPDQPDEVKRRLFPDPSNDEGIRKDWEKYVQPELFALVASAREVVSKDLRGIGPSKTPGSFGTWRLEIPAEHVKAWISALNAARLALGAVHGVDSEEDLHPDLFDDDEEGGEEAAERVIDERRIAIARIHVLGELQAMLIFDRHPPPDDPDDPELKADS